MTTNAVPQTHESQRARSTLLWDGLFARLMDALTGGAILAGLGLQAGADSFTLGLLASLPSFAQVAQFPAVKMLLRFPDRKRVTIIAGALGRFVLFIVAFLLWRRPEWVTPWPLIGLMALMAFFVVVSGAAWNWWVRDVIPREELGRYFGRRMRITTTAAALAGLAAGALLDVFVEDGRPADGYALLLSLGGLAGMISLGFLARTPHPPTGPTPAPRRTTSLILRQLSEPGNARLVLAMALMAATLTACLPFAAVFLLQQLGLNFLTVTLLALLSQVGYVSGLRGWGHLSDRFGIRPTLQISLGLVVAALAGWGLSWGRAGPLLLTGLGLLHFLTGFGIGGIELMSGNVVLKTAPDRDAPAYMAAMSLTRAASAGLATVLAGAAWQVLGTGPLLTVAPFGGVSWTVRGFHVLALASVVLGFLSIAALSKVREQDGVPVHEVARAMRREVRMISTVAGIRAFVHVVSYAVEFLTVPRRIRGAKPAARPNPGHEPPGN